MISPIRASLIAGIDEGLSRNGSVSVLGALLVSHLGLNFGSSAIAVPVSN
jgi:hypothetical protein